MGLQVVFLDDLLIVFQTIGLPRIIAAMDQLQKRIPRPKLALDWTSQRAEFGVLLQATAEARLGAKAFSTPQTGSTPPEWAFRVDDTSIRSHLRLQPKGRKLCIFVVGPPDLARDEVDRWDEVVREAFALMGLDHHQWPWAAIIAPPLDSAGQGKCVPGHVTVGALTLRPGSRAINRRPRQVPWQFPPIARAWPVVVEGVAWYRGPIWSIDSWTGMRQATRQLYRLCALLTVVLDGRPWTLELAPAPGLPGFMDVPDHLIDPDGWESPFHRDLLDIPDWLEPSLSAVEADGQLDRALTAYYEGAQLRMTGHPSAALVAFASCIESLSTARAGAPCPECGEARGSTDRFWGAVRDVLAPDELGQLGDPYKLRSRTAHDGTLHGFEVTYGQMPFDHFILESDPRYFLSPQLYLVMRAAGLLLVRAIQERERTHLGPQ